MKFTYEEYENLILKLKKENYEFSNYENYNLKEKVVILRHDVDTSLEKALEIARLEKKLEVSSYYFVLLSTDFYNINSERSLNILKEIIKLGGKIGLHFDEKKYKLKTEKEYINMVKYECEILSLILNQKVNVVSMHRPSKEFLEMNLQIPNIINSYQKIFFNEFKYVSDSRMFWRENIEEIINSNVYNQLHILTHPFWYSNVEETMKEKLKKFLDKAIEERYISLNENIKDFEKIILRAEIDKFKEEEI